MTIRNDNGWSIPKPLGVPVPDEQGVMGQLLLESNYAINHNQGFTPLDNPLNFSDTEDSFQTLTLNFVAMVFNEKIHPLRKEKRDAITVFGETGIWRAPGAPLDPLLGGNPFE